jgi:hypothetical protein
MTSLGECVHLVRLNVLWIKATRQRAADDSSSERLIAANLSPDRVKYELCAQTVGVPHREQNRACLACTVMPTAATGADRSSTEERIGAQVTLRRTRTGEWKESSTTSGMVTRVRWSWADPPRVSAATSTRVAGTHAPPGTREELHAGRVGGRFVDQFEQCAHISNGRIRQEGRRTLAFTVAHPRWRAGIDAADVGSGGAQHRATGVSEDAYPAQRGTHDGFRCPTTRLHGR